MKNATQAQPSPMATRLFDFREPTRASEGSVAGRSLGDAADTRLILHPQADPVFVEQYRHLGAAMHAAKVEKGIRSVMVTSAVAAEGKTLSATNLALTLSRSYRQRVLLVDGDLRKPSVHQLLKLENGIGLSDILKQPAPCIQTQMVSPTLSVITAGHHDPDPVALLVSDAMGQFLAATRDHFDWVVVDTPPVVLFPDAGLFAGRLDACLMVVSAATTMSPVAATAVAAIGAWRILGVVLNRAEASEIAAGHAYGAYGYAASGGPRNHLS